MNHPGFIKMRYSPYDRVKKVEIEHAHCMQLKPSVHATGFDHILCHGKYPRLKYSTQDKREYEISTLHRGQRKLLMSEIGALLELNPEETYTVVYAGAAPGNHIPFLSLLFPNIVFYLYDPLPFKIKESKNIKLFNEYFTDQTAQQYASTTGTKLVFVCDIRRTNDEKLVWEDMLAQKNWHEIMRPALTSLKFRLPWPGCGVVDSSNLIDYLDGDIHLPVWGPCNTTESRLVIDPTRHSGERTYNCLAYEEEMCHFNRLVRPSIHSWQTDRADSLDGCYDCTAEVELIRKYSKKYQHTELTTKRITLELRRGIDVTPHNRECQTRRSRNNV
jgi:cap2 methyltransferase